MRYTGNSALGLRFSISVYQVYQVDFTAKKPKRKPVVDLKQSVY